MDIEMLNYVSEQSPQNKKRRDKFSMPTLYYLKENGNLDLELYLQNQDQKGKTNSNITDRSAASNRSIYGEFVRNNQEIVEKYCQYNSWVFRMHTEGHLDIPVFGSKTPRKIEHYFNGFYSIKSHAINDYLIFLSNSPTDEEKRLFIESWENRFHYLAGSNIEIEDYKPTEYSLKKIETLIQKIEFLLKDGQYKHETRINKLIDYLSLIIQESLLLAVSFKYIFELTENQTELEQVKEYARKIVNLCSKYKLKLVFINSLSDELKYRINKYRESIVSQSNISDISLPINILIYSASLTASYDRIGDPRHYTNDQVAKMYDFGQYPSSALEQIKPILLKMLNKEISDGKGLRLLSEKVVVDFNELVNS